MSDYERLTVDLQERSYDILVGRSTNRTVAA